MPEIDFAAVDKPRFTRPQLLSHHTIPPPLFGTAPRYYLGQEWWDKTRRTAYEANNMRCWACGGPGPLEAHEAYDIDYYKARMTYVETVALCNDCHSFIHIGRTIGQFAQGNLTSRNVQRIVWNGYQLLKSVGLPCPWETHVIESPRLPWKGSKKWIKEVLDAIEPSKFYPSHSWESWRMVVFGQHYPPRYSSLEDFKRKVL